MQTTRSQSEPSVVLYVLKSEKYSEQLIDVLRQITGDHKVVTYVTTNRPYKLLLNSLEANQIPHQGMFFIDCISKHVGAESDAPNCYCVRSPQDLVEMSIAISKTLEHVSGEKILLLDSLSVLLLYNDALAVGRFSNFLINKMRVAGVSSVILALESDAGKDVIKQVESIVDEVKTFAT